MNQVNALKKSAAWITGGFISVVLFLFAESWLILASKVFGPIWGTLICFSIATPIAFIVIYLTASSGSGTWVSNWIREQETKLSKRVQIAARYGKFVAVVFTAVTLGPILSAILMVLLGLESRKIYLYSVLCSLLCYSIWCSIYSGVWWVIFRYLWR